MVGERARGGLVVAAIVAAATVMATAGTAQACSCIERELAEYADDIAVAFAGSQVERTMHSYYEDNGLALVFSVDRVYKGEAGPLIEVRTHAQGQPACGIDMDGHGTVGVVARERQGDLAVNLCGSVVSVGALADVFGDGHPPDESIRLPGSAEDSSFTSIVLVVAGAAIVLLAGAVAWRRRS